MCLKFIDSLYTFAKAISVCGAEGGKMVVTKTSTDSNYAMNLHTAESRSVPGRENLPSKLNHIGPKRDKSGTF